MKVLLLDADGVVLQKGEYFSERFAREHNVELGEVLEFFKGPFGSCQKGEADLKEELPPFLEKWGWKDGVDAFVTYWFDHDIVLNEEIAKTITSFRQKGIQCYLASNNEKYRADAIRSFLKEKELLDGTFFSSDENIRTRKEDPSFFSHILMELGVGPEDALFLDNDQKNVDSATSVGIQAMLYHEGLLEELLTKI